MFRLRNRRKVAALAVILVLALPWCAAAARPGSEPGNTAIRVPSAPLEVLRTGFWNWLRGMWTKGGCGIDPSGQPACGPTNAGHPDPAATTSNADGGCTIDPDGSPCGGRQ